MRNERMPLLSARSSKSVLELANGKNDWRKPKMESFNEIRITKRKGRTRKGKARVQRITRRNDKIIESRNERSDGNYAWRRIRSSWNEVVPNLFSIEQNAIEHKERVKVT